MFYDKNLPLFINKRDAVYRNIFSYINKEDCFSSSSFKNIILMIQYVYNNKRTRCANIEFLVQLFSRMVSYLIQLFRIRRRTISLVGRVVLFLSSSSTCNNPLADNSRGFILLLIMYLYHPVSHVLLRRNKCKDKKRPPEGSSFLII